MAIPNRLAGGTGCLGHARGGLQVAGLIIRLLGCVDRQRQWKRAGNVRNGATLRTARHTLTAPIRWITRRG